MPIISRFFGIMIIMYWNDHNPPHFHAKYADYDAIISIDGRLIGGALPNRAMKLVLEWLNLHTTELLENWYRAANGQEIKSIAPLE